MTPHRWHDDMEQLLGVYAVDAVDAEERHAVDRHLRRCRSCAAEVSGYREVAAAVALLGVRVVDHGRRLDRMQTTMADAGLRRSAVAALADPASDRLALSSPDTPAVAQAAILPDGRGYLVTDPLPRLAPDRTYQLWMLIDQERISAGILGSRPLTSAFHVGQEIDGLAITEEPAEGVVVSHNAPVVFGRLTGS